MPRHLLIATPLLGLLVGCDDRRHLDTEPVVPGALEGRIDVSTWAGAAALVSDFTPGCVAGPGDLDGDGFDDLIVGHGQQGADPAGAWVYYGRATPLPTHAAVSDLGPQLRPEVGERVCAQRIGDVDGDGIDDTILATHATWLARGGERFEDGAVVSEISEMLDQPLPREFAAVGDADGDGVSDIAVLKGRNARVLFGAPDLLVDGSGPDDAHIVMEVGEPGGEYFTDANPMPGDLDGDGLDDFIVRVHDESGGGPGWRLEVAYGDLDRAAVGTARATLTSETKVEVVGLGDLDADGHADLLVADGELRLLVVPGSAERRSGTVAFAEVAIELASDVTQARVVGDLDGDGSAELTAMRRNDAGPQLLIWYGSPRADLADLAPSAQLDFPGSALSYRAQCVGDLNGDGHGELVVIPLASFGEPPRAGDDALRPVILYTGPRSGR